MCVVSMVMDYYGDKWKDYQPKDKDNIFTVSYIPNIPNDEPITKEEVREFKELLERARQYDIKNKEPDCESKEKMAKLRAIFESIEENFAKCSEAIAELRKTLESFDDKSV